MEQFVEFIDRKQREAKKHLKLVERLLRKSGLQVEGHLDADDPYVFLQSPNKKLSFDGVRIYEIGTMIAYRIQKERNTEPYGKAYLLDVEDMFNDYMSENMKEEEAGKKVIESVVREMKKFFDKSADAEQEAKGDEAGVVLKTGGTDYSTLVLNKL
jgi:hypothetical protein